MTTGLFTRLNIHIDHRCHKAEQQVDEATFEATLSNGEVSSVNTTLDATICPS